MFFPHTRWRWAVAARRFVGVEKSNRYSGWDVIVASTIRVGIVRREVSVSQQQ